MEETAVNVYEVAKVFISDRILVENWKILYHKLAIQNENLPMEGLQVQLDRGVLNNDLIILQILSTWINPAYKPTVKDLCEILASWHFKTVADNLEEKFLLASIITDYPKAIVSEESCYADEETDDEQVPFCFEVPQPNPNFVGRQKELKHLNYLIQTSNRVVVVTGNSGIGKTQLITKFASTFFTSSKGSVIWLNGSNDNTLKNSIVRLTGLKETDNVTQNQNRQSKYISETDAWLLKAVDYVCTKVKSQPALMLIDNFNSTGRIVEKCIQYFNNLSAQNALKVIVTSRNSDILAFGQCYFEPLIIKPFVFEDAFELVSRSLGKHLNPEAVHSLCETLQYFPLALSLAVAYINMNRKVSVDTELYIRDYLDAFQVQKQKLLGQVDSDYDLLVLTAWNITFKIITSDRILGLGAVAIINILAYSNFKDLSLDNLNYISGTFNLPETYTISMKVIIEWLQCYSICNIVESSPSNKCLMHSLLQEVIRVTNIQHRASFLKSAVEYTPPHAGTVFQDITRNVLADVFKTDALVRENRETLHRWCVRILKETVNFDQVERLEMIQKYIEVITRVFGKESRHLWAIFEACIPLINALQTINYCPTVISIFAKNEIEIVANKTVAQEFLSIVNLDSFEYFSGVQREMSVEDLSDFYRFVIQYSCDSNLRRHFQNVLFNLNGSRENTIAQYFSRDNEESREIVQYLGGGSFGIVFRVESSEIRETANKFIFPDIETMSDEISEFAKEFTLLQNKHHTNVTKSLEFRDFKVCSEKDIASIFHIVNESSKIDIPDDMLDLILKNIRRAKKKNGIKILCIEMELCGKTLRTWLNNVVENKIIAEKKAQSRILNDIVSGLKFLHDMNIIHRDLKPSNIYFSISDKTTLEEFSFPVKIGDFGQSREVQGDDSLTLSKNVCTRLYRAPELNHRIDFKTRYGKQADIYSLGLVTWEIFHPTPCIHLENRFDRLVVDRDVSLITECTEVPKLKSLILDSTERNKRNRIKSVAEFSLYLL